MVCGEVWHLPWRQARQLPYDLFQANEWYRQPAVGCSRITTLSCEAPQDRRSVEINRVTFFIFSSDLTDVDSETCNCKHACLVNCACKAALFRNGWNSSAGNCYPISEIFNFEQWIMRRKRLIITQLFTLRFRACRCHVQVQVERNGSGK